MHFYIKVIQVTNINLDSSSLDRKFHSQICSNIFINLIFFL